MSEPIPNGKPFNLETAVERCVECVPLGARQGAMRRRSPLFRQAANAALLDERTRCTHCRALTHQVTPVAAHPLGSTHTFHPSLSGQLPLLGSMAFTRVCALQAQCPHQEIPLAEGTLIGRTLTCPCCAQLWQFDVQTGKGINPRECSLALYPVEIRNDEVDVDVSGIKPHFTVG